LQEEVENTRQQLLDLKKEQNESKKKKKNIIPLGLSVRHLFTFTVKVLSGA